MKPRGLHPPLTETDLPTAVVDAIRAVVGNGPVPLHAPIFAGNEWEYLKQCLDSTFVSSVGEFVDRLEADLTTYTGAKHAVAVVNGTAALHVALMLGGVRPGDEVLVPALTFVATAAAVKYCGAVPHFVDSEERTLGMDAAALRRHLNAIADLSSGTCTNRLTGRPIRAVVPMHTFGHPVGLDPIVALACELGIVVVEDAAESLGSLYRGRHTGTLGRMGTLSFNGNKTITTGGGGAILTDDQDLARAAKHLTTTAKLPHRWDFVHDQVGFNYRMPNLNAALGCAQLEQLPALIDSKRQLYTRYRDALARVDGVRLMAEPYACRSNYWLQTLILDHGHEEQRDRILAATNDLGLMTRPAWRLPPSLQPYEDCPRAPLPVAQSLERRLINLPSSGSLA